MNLLYISPSTLPSRSANSVHVMRMCNAFANNGYNVELLCKTQSIQSDKLIFDFYGINYNNFHIKTLFIKTENKLSSLIYAIWTFIKSLNLLY